MSRDLDKYFAKIVLAVAMRSTCIDKQVGCVLIDDRHNILSTGYNGAPRNIQHCSNTSVCWKHKGQPCIAVHAEQNAMLRANPDKVWRAVCTLEPCIECTKMLMNTNCREVVFIHNTSIGKSGRGLWTSINPYNSWRQINV